MKKWNYYLVFIVSLGKAQECASNGPLPIGFYDPLDTLQINYIAGAQSYYLCGSIANPNIVQNPVETLNDGGNGFSTATRIPFFNYRANDLEFSLMGFHLPASLQWEEFKFCDKYDNLSEKVNNYPVSYI